MVNLDNSAKDVRMSKDALPKCRLYGWTSHNLDDSYKFKKCTYGEQQ